MDSTLPSHPTTLSPSPLADLQPSSDQTTSTGPWTPGSTSSSHSLPTRVPASAHATLTFHNEPFLSSHIKTSSSSQQTIMQAKPPPTEALPSANSSPKPLPLHRASGPLSSSTSDHDPHSASTRASAQNLNPPATGDPPALDTCASEDQPSAPPDTSAIAEFYKLPPQERRRLKRLVHPSKRKRIAVACDSCKRRKQKCDGNNPCSLCKERGFECVFSKPVPDQRMQALIPLIKRRRVSKKPAPDSGLNGTGSAPETSPGDATAPKTSSSSAPKTTPQTLSQQPSAKDSPGLSGHSDYSSQASPNTLHHTRHQHPSHADSASPRSPAMDPPSEHLHPSTTSTTAAPRSPSMPYSTAPPNGKLPPPTSNKLPGTDRILQSISNHFTNHPAAVSVGSVTGSLESTAAAMLAHSSPSPATVASPGSHSLSSNSPLTLGDPASPHDTMASAPHLHHQHLPATSLGLPQQSPALTTISLPPVSSTFPIQSQPNSIYPPPSSNFSSMPSLHSAMLSTRNPLKLQDYQVESVGEGKDPRLLYDRKTGNMRYLGESCTLSLVEQIRSLFRQRIGESAFTEDPERYIMVDGPKFSVSLIPVQLPSKRLTTYLVQAFEKHVQPTGFVLMFPQYWRDVDQIYESPVSASNSQLCLLYLAIALGGVYFTTPPIEANIDADTAQELQHIKLSSYFESALGYLRDTFEDGDLWVVQAYFMVSLYYDVMCKRNASWVQLGISIRYAQALGMGRKWIDLSFSPTMQDYRKRLYRTLFLRDRLGSIYLGRPMAFGYDELEQYVMEDPKCKDDEAQIQMVKLCQIIGDIWNNVYRSRYISSSTSQSLTTRLKAWSASFRKFACDTAVEQQEKEEERKMRNQDPSTSFSKGPNNPTAGSSLKREPTPATTHDAGIIDVSHKIPWDQHQLLNLNMTYLHGIILLTRPFLFYMAARRSSSTSSLDPDAIRTLENLASKCVQSALTSVKLMENTFFNNRHPKRSTLVSYYIFTSGVMLLLRAYKCIPAEQSSLSAGISGSLRILSYYSNVDPSAKRFWNILKEMHMAVSQRQISIINNTAGETPNPSGGMPSSLHENASLRREGNGNPAHRSNEGPSGQTRAVTLPKDVPSLSASMQNLQSKISKQGATDPSCSPLDPHDPSALGARPASADSPGSSFITRTPSFVTRIMTSSSVPTPSADSPLAGPSNAGIYSSTASNLGTLSSAAAAAAATSGASTPTPLAQQLPSIVVPSGSHGMSMPMSANVSSYASAPTVTTAVPGSAVSSPSLGHTLPPLPINAGGSPSSLFMNIEEIDFTTGELDQWLFTSTGPVIDSLVNGAATAGPEGAPVASPEGRTTSASTAEHSHVLSSTSPSPKPSKRVGGRSGAESDGHSARDERHGSNGVSQEPPLHHNQVSHHSMPPAQQYLPPHQNSLAGCMGSASTPPRQTQSNDNGPGVAETATTPLQPDYLSPEFDTIRGFLMHPGY